MYEGCKRTISEEESLSLETPNEPQPSQSQRVQSGSDGQRPQRSSQSQKPQQPPHAKSHNSHSSQALMAWGGCSHGHQAEYFQAGQIVRARHEAYHMPVFFCSQKKHAMFFRDFGPWAGTNTAHKAPGRARHEKHVPILIFYNIFLCVFKCFFNFYRIFPLKCTEWAKKS